MVGKSLLTKTLLHLSGGRKNLIKLFLPRVGVSTLSIKHGHLPVTPGIDKSRYRQDERDIKRFLFINLKPQGIMFDQ